MFLIGWGWFSSLAVSFVMCVQYLTFVQTKDHVHGLNVGQSYSTGHESSQYSKAKCNKKHEFELYQQSQLYCIWSTVSLSLFET